jgi:hypothetical protein
MLVRSRVLEDAHGINEMKGRMFRVDELTEHVREILENRDARRAS